MTALADKARLSVVWTTGYAIFRDLLQFGLTLTLTRILPHEAYGYFGFVTAVIGFFTVISFREFLNYTLQVRSDEETCYQDQFTAGAVGYCAYDIVRQIEKHEWIMNLPRITEEVDDRLEEGIDWIDGDPKHAAAIFLELIEKYQEHMDAYHHLALTLEKMGRKEEAFQTGKVGVDTALKCFPDHFSMERDQLEWGFVENRPFLRLYHSYGLQLMERGKTEDALDVFGITFYRLALPGAAQVRINAPMHEHPEARLAPPRHALVVCFHRLAPPGQLWTVFIRHTERTAFRRSGKCSERQQRGQQSQCPD